jgi:hypothetical protein
VLPFAVLVFGIGAVWIRGVPQGREADATSTSMTGTLVMDTLEGTEGLLKWLEGH